MKKIISLTVALLLIVFCFAGCRTREETRPENDTTTPKPAQCDLI